MRWLRWASMRAIGRAAPRAAHAFAFPMKSVAAISAASKVIENSITRLRIAVSQSETDAILRPAMANDLGDTSTYPSAESPLRTQIAIIDDCDILGSTHTIVRQSDGALVHAKDGVPDWNLAKPIRLTSRRCMHPLVFVCEKGSHYFHFIANDVIPLLHYLDGPREERLTILHGAQDALFKRNGLAAIAIGYDGVSTALLDPRERLTGARALWAQRLGATHEWLPIDRAWADRWFRLLTRGNLPASNASPRIFVGRGNARLRRLLNEAELAEALAGHGYASFLPSADDQLTQIDAFHRADRIVAVHGAALTNLIFCRPGTRVVEIFPSNFIKSPYFWLSRRLGLEYSFVLGGKGNYYQAFRVDPAAVIKAIR